MHPLDGPRLKLKRANIHIRALDRSIKRHLGAKDDAVVAGQYDIKGIGMVYGVDTVAPTSWESTKLTTWASVVSNTICAADDCVRRITRYAVNLGPT